MTEGSKAFSIFGDRLREWALDYVLDETLAVNGTWIIDDFERRPADCQQYRARFYLPPLGKIRRGKRILLSVDLILNLPL